MYIVGGHRRNVGHSTSVRFGVRDGVFGRRQGEGAGRPQGLRDVLGRGTRHGDLAGDDPGVGHLGRPARRAQEVPGKIDLRGEGGGRATPVPRGAGRGARLRGRGERLGGLRLARHPEPGGGAGAHGGPGGRDGRRARRQEPRARAARGGARSQARDTKKRPGRRRLGPDGPGAGGVG